MSGQIKICQASEFSFPLLTQFCVVFHSQIRNFVRQTSDLISKQQVHLNLNCSMIVGCWEQLIIHDKTLHKTSPDYQIDVL